jgi:hypothetical protein
LGECRQWPAKTDVSEFAFHFSERNVKRQASGAVNMGPAHSCEKLAKSTRPRYGLAPRTWRHSARFSESPHQSPALTLSHASKRIQLIEIATETGAEAVCGLERKAKVS